MKKETICTDRRRTAAGICAVLMITGYAAGTFASCASAGEEAAPKEEQGYVSAAYASANDTISADGTVASSKLEDDLGIRNTSVRLTVEETLVSSGDSVKEGTPLYRITEESLEKAEKTFLSELSSAENALLEKKTSCLVEKSKAKALYESELMLGNTAQNDYNGSMSALNDSLQEAYSAYSEAIGTINNAPTDISSKKAELGSLREDTEKLQTEEETLRGGAEAAKKAYDSASESYDAALSELRTAAGVVASLETALGIDPAESRVIDIKERNAAADKGSSGKISAKTDTAAKTAPDEKTDTADDPSKLFPENGSLPDLDFPKTDDDAANRTGKTVNVSERKANAGTPDTADTGMTVTDKDERFGGDNSGEYKLPEDTVPQNFGEIPERGDHSRGFSDAEGKAEDDADEENKITEEMLEEYAAERVKETLNELYEKACEEQQQKKSAAEKSEKAYNEAESRYNEINDKLEECGRSIGEKQSSLKDLEKEIAALERELSEAKSSLSRLRSQYDSLSNSYEKDKLEIKHTLDKDTASYENAEYHYDMTCSTLDNELAEAQEAFDTAEKNMQIFGEILSEGYVSADREGVVYSVSWQEGRNADITAPYICYVDENSFFTTVELDQNDVTKVNIGDTAFIYSSETGMARGRITAVSEGTAKSLADVRFNVTVSADEGSALYVGQTVNVFFGTAAANRSGTENGRGSAGGISGMPGSVTMPEYGRRKED